MIPQDSGRRSLESGEKEGIFSTMKKLKGMKIGASRKLRCNFLSIKSVGLLSEQAHSQSDVPCSATASLAKLVLAVGFWRLAFGRWLLVDSF
jgi:hypothetical protein